MSPMTTQRLRSSRATTSTPRRSSPAMEARRSTLAPSIPAATNFTANITKTAPKAPWSRDRSMLGALIIVFREVVEAGLVVGIVLAATHGIAGRGWWVSLGIVAGVLGASIVAAFAGAISNAFAGSGQELLNATVLIVAVISLTWHNVWMAEHGREIVAELRQVGDDVSAGRRPLTALAVVVFVAVMREGSEIVLFLYGIVVTGTSMGSLLLGGVLGLLGGAAM